jgi:hypothetical protein
MSQNHSYDIEKLKVNFANLITIQKNITKTKTTLGEQINQLKSVYNDLIKANNKKIFLFCLDSFFFQYKTFLMEIDHIDKTRTMINNRMYCDYYKLYNIIINHIKESRIELSKEDLEIKSFPVYKDLEPFQEYKIEDICDIHENILQLINKLHTQSRYKNDDINNYSENHRIGFSISNFLNTLEYENRLLQEQITLYVNYVSFFHISQKKQLMRLFSKIQDFQKELEENIHLNMRFSIDDIDEEKQLNRFIVLDEEVKIDSILDDSEFLIENTEKICNRIEKFIDASSNENIEIVITDKIYEIKENNA